MHRGVSERERAADRGIATVLANSPSIVTAANDNVYRLACRMNDIALAVRTINWGGRTQEQLAQAWLSGRELVSS